MPRGDGTGPMGYGRMTGRGVGYCAGFETPGYANTVEFGYGFGRGRRIRRMRHGAALWRCAYFWHPAYVEPEVDVFVERDVLSRQAKILEQQLQLVRKRLSNLEEHLADEDEEKEE